MTDHSRFSGMTTNERLFEAGLLDDYDEAARLKDKQRMVELLGMVGLASQAEWIAKTSLERT